MEGDGVISETDVLEGLNLNFFKYTFLWDTINHYRTYKTTSKTFYVGLAISLAVLGFFCGTQFIWLFIIEIDVTTLCLGILNPLCALQSLFKVIVFHIHIKKQSEIFSLIRKDYLPSIGKEKQLRAAAIYKTVTKKLNFYCYIAVLNNLNCLLVWGSMPIIRSRLVSELLGIYYEVDPDKALLHTTVALWFPVANPPFTESPLNEIVYLFELSACSLCLFLNACYAIVVITVVLTLAAHLTVLGHFIAEVTAQRNNNAFDMTESTTTYKSQQRIYANLVLYIKDHQHLVKMGNDLKTLFNFLLTLQMCIGILVVIIAIFHFVLFPDPVITFKFITILTFQAAEIMLYCFSGTFLETASTNIASAAYNTEWYNKQIQFQKAVQMIMIRSQFPVSLRAMRIYPINSLTLLSMMQFTYSASAFLNNFVK